MAKRGRPKKATDVKETAVAVVEEPKVPAIVDAQALIARAIDKNLPIESMERLLAMRRELKAEQAKEQYFSALARFQRECPTIGKDKRVNDKSGKKRYSYAPLEQIVEEVKALLSDCGFSYSTAPEQTVDSVTAVCVSHHIGGHSEVTKFTVPIDHEAYMNEPQKVASALTYATRYAFRNAFGIMTGDDDDDAQSAGEPAQERRTVYDVTPKPAPQKSDVEVAHDNLVALYKQMIPLKVFTPEELEGMKEDAVKAKDNLNSLVDLFNAWSNETKERQKK